MPDTSSKEKNSNITRHNDSVTGKGRSRFPRQPNANDTYLANTPGKSLPFADQIGNYQRNIGLPTDQYKDSQVYIVGSGIAGLAAAYYCIRDGKVPAENITFLEQLEVPGGSLDGAGNPETGYIVRGGREMDFTYENFWDLFQDIPALEMPEPYSVLDEYHVSNDTDPNYSIARLLHNQGEVKDFSKLGLGKTDQLKVIRLLLKRKDQLNDMSIEDYFDESFLKSNFWTFWRTMFAFENWHSLLELKLYMHRFLHALDGLHDMSALVFPKYNQFDTFVVPLRNYLTDQGVQFQYDTVVTDLEINFDSEDNVSGDKQVTAIVTETSGKSNNIELKDHDFVIVTTGSMTEDTRYGDNDTPPDIDIPKDQMGQSAGWQLWNNIAKQSEIFGRPEKFNRHVDKSAWMSATLTCQPSALIDKLKTLSVNDPYSGKTATGGIITMTDSNWLMSFTCNRQPHFPDQPKDTLVLWVYALLMDKDGNYVKKTMPECTGNEILAELCYHLGIIDELEDIKENTIVRTAYMPYITSMFMPRAEGDRPEIVPEGCRNLGLIGQFVETNNDVVFTMESSVRSARVAVYELFKVQKQVPDINPLQYDIRHLLRAAHTLSDGKGFIGEGLLRKLLQGTYYDHILPSIDESQRKTEKTNESIFVKQWEAIKGLWQ